MKHYINKDGNIQGFWEQGCTEISEEQLSSYFSPTVPEIKRFKILELNNACESEIYNTRFESSALGAIHSYDCREKDQINLACKIAGGTGAEVWAHTQPKFDEVYHTHSQLIALQQDMNAHIKSSTSKYRSLYNQVEAISENSISAEDDINAITW